MKKRIFSVLMFLLMTITLVACSTSPSVSDTGNQTDNIQTIDPQNDPLAFLEAAGEKLKNASSFELSSSWIFKRTDDATEENAVADTYIVQYEANVDGYPVTKTWPSNDSSDYCYLHKDAGYSFWLSNPVTHQSESSFTPTQLFWLLDNQFDIKNQTMFDDFCVFDPVVTCAEDGTVNLLIKSLSYDQYIALQGGRQTGHITDFKHSSYSAQLTVDPQGYLSKIRFMVENPKFDFGQTRKDETFCLEYAFSNINTDITISVPGENDFSTPPNEETLVAQHFGECFQSIYQYDPETDSYDFMIIASHMSEDAHDIVPCYKVQTEINERPVRRIIGTLGLARGCDIERLVIPAGISFSDRQGAPDSTTLLFFEDSKENAVYDFVLPGDGEYSTVKAAYFAGEWKYVDGVPTPNA